MDATKLPKMWQIYLDAFSNKDILAIKNYYGNSYTIVTSYTDSVSNKKFCINYYTLVSVPKNKNELLATTIV
jgi:hypothetical protein